MAKPHAPKKAKRKGVHPQVRKVSAFLICTNGPNILVGLARNNIWAAPGGQVKKGENLWKAALREADAEVGKLRHTLLSSYVAVTCVTPQGKVLKAPKAGQAVEVKVCFIVHTEGFPRQKSREIRTPMFLNPAISRPVMRPSLEDALEQFRLQGLLPIAPAPPLHKVRPDYGAMAAAMHALNLPPALIRACMAPTTQTGKGGA